MSKNMKWGVYRIHELDGEIFGTTLVRGPFTTKEAEVELGCAVEDLWNLEEEPDE